MIDVEKSVRNGASYDDIIKAITAEYKDANKKITEENAKKEQDKKNKAEIETARTNLVNAMVNYYKTLFPDSELRPEDAKEITSSLLDFEKSMSSLSDMIKFLL